MAKVSIRVRSVRGRDRERRDVLLEDRECGGEVCVRAVTSSTRQR